MTNRRGHHEGTIYKRRDGRWAAAVDLGWSAGRRRRKYVYGRSRRDVSQKLNAALSQRDSGLPLPPERQTVGQFLDHWLQAAARTRVRSTTHKRYTEIVRGHIAPAIGHVRLVRLTPQHVQQLLAEAGDTSPLSPRTIEMIHGVLRNALNDALRWDLVSRNVATRVTPPRVEHREIAPLSEKEARAFLRAARGNRLEALYRVALAVGLRQAEALGLRWRDVDLDGGRLHVRAQLQRIDGKPAFVEPKSARARRTIALPDPLSRALREHRARQNTERLSAGPLWENYDLVFATRRGRPLGSRNVTRSFRDLTRRAGIRDVRFHDLRHTAATFLLAQGVDVRTLMGMLGHSQIGLTLNTYAHVLPALGRDAANRMGSLIDRLDTDERDLAVNLAVNGPSATD